MARVAGVAEPAVAELLDEKGDPLITIATVSKARMAQEAVNRFVQLHSFR